ncbi:MAG: proton-conducting transporter membrane subunit [Candidatus Bathyarchaeia archaeon]
MVNDQAWLVLTPLATLLGAAMLTPIVASAARRARPGGGKAVDVFAVLGFTVALYTLYRLYLRVYYSGSVSVALDPYLPVKGGVELHVDMLSVYMAMIFCGIGLLASIYSVRYMEGDTGHEYYYLLLLTLVAGMVGVAFAGDFFNLFVSWELMCISSYALVSFRKYRWEPIEAGFKYLMMSSLGSLTILYGISLLYGLTGTVNFRLIRVGLDSIAEAGVPSLLYILIALIIVGFGVTASMVPFHTWLPDAHPAAPSPISAMLSGVVIKTGVYGLGRSLFTLFNPVAFDYGTAILIFAALTMTVANFVALLQRDIKRLLAYSSIANIGYITAGLGIAAYALSHYYPVDPGLALKVALLGASGALFHIFNHAVGKGLLFLCSGCFVHETGTRDISQLEGVGRRMFLTGTSFTLGLFSLAGVPPLSGFWSKLFIILAGLSIAGDTALYTITAILIFNSVLSAAYYLWLMQRIMLRKPSGLAAEAVEAPGAMVIPVIILAAVSLLVGLAPGGMITLMEYVSKALMGGW